MAFKGFFNSVKNEVQNEIGRQIEKSLNKNKNSDGSSQTVDASTLEGLLGLLGGGGGSSAEQLETLINAIQGKTGGFLPQDVGKYLPGILKVAEVIGHGMGDESKRTDQNADGSLVDNFVRTIVGGRKIHGGKNSKVMPVSKAPDYAYLWKGKKGQTGHLKYTGSSEGFQDYQRIKAKCLEEGTLYEDPEFPADSSSVYFSNNEGRKFQWLRPHFFVEGATRFDVKQGELGDCWLLAAVANLTLNPKLFHDVVLEDNSFDEEYAGVFHFRFWQYGRWVEVVVDDRIPTIEGSLAFMHSTEKNEFWSSLLEKAYAKLYGSYEALKGGTTCEALEDFTGGVTEIYDLKTAPPNLFEMVLKAFERSSFLGCSIEPDPHQFEAQTALGLVKGHAYSITDVKLVDIETPRVKGKIPLLRIRNPWGNETEWKGPWSDGSKEWQFINDETKQDLGLTFDADGEFWMSFKDFSTNFDRIEICNLNPDSLEEDEIDSAGKKKWNTNVFEGSWIRGATAGGCRNYLESFACNPQYIINLEDPDEDDNETNCTIIVALMQKNRRVQRKLGVDCLTIGFAIYHLTGDNLPSPLSKNFFKYTASVARSPTFINLREVCSRFKLVPGKYCIIPSTFEPNEEGEFIIRVFTEGRNVMTQNDSDVGTGEVDERNLADETTGNDGSGRSKMSRENSGCGTDALLVKLIARGIVFAIQNRSAVSSICASNNSIPVDNRSPDSESVNLQQLSDTRMRQSLQKKGKALLADALLEYNVKESEREQNEAAKRVQEFFKTVAGDDMEIDWAELKDVLDIAMKKEFAFDGFSKDVCRSMVAMMDTDRSGKLGLEEFIALWKSIRIWKNVFQLYDKDKSGHLSSFELRQALTSAGYHVNNRVIEALALRYGDSKGQMFFDDFIMCAVKLKCMIEIYKDKEAQDEDKIVRFTLEEWVEKTLYS